MSIHVIGDVHGHYNRYAKLTKMFPYTLQLGDFGFSYGIFSHFNIDPEKHVFFGGNHDNYEILEKAPRIANNLGNYGYTELNDIKFFYVRGAWSIDRKWRTMGVDLWEQEEVNEEWWEDIIEMYREYKPRYMITHDCPYEVTKYIFGTDGLEAFGWPRSLITNTGRLLQMLWDIHKPEIWCFGHYHEKKEVDILGTKFVCVPELGVYELGA